MGLQIKTHGILLGTEQFDACVAFYRDLIGLPVWFSKPGLVCFRFGDGYLMVETAETASDFRRSGAGASTMLRCNVDDVRAAANMLVSLGVTVDVQEHNWGIVGTFFDPGGNPCELKNADDPFFQPLI
jgi:lactoylglutathione lyase